MALIYIVEDDRGIAKGIEECLKNWGMEGRQVSDFRNILAEIESYNPHLVLMDITLPYMGGYYWCREIRKTSSVPIIFISSAADSMNLVMAMDMGADDFIAKPFDRSVLIAKVSALLRRAYDFGRPANVVQAAGAVLNTENRTLTYHGAVVELARNEYRILLTLMDIG